MNYLLNILADLVPFGMLLLGGALVWRSWWRRTGDARERARDVRRFKGRCPICGYDLRAGHTLCPECGGPGRERRVDDPGHLNRRALLTRWPSSRATPMQPRKPDPQEQPLAFHVTDSAADAILLVQQLQAHGLWSWLDRPEGDVTPDPAGQAVREYRVMIWSGDQPSAAAVLAKFTQSPTAASSSPPADCRDAADVYR